MLDRNRFVLQTKVGRVLEPAPNDVEGGLFAKVLPFKPRFDYSASGIVRSLEDSIQRLGLSRVDFALIYAADPTVHGVEGFKRSFVKLWSKPTLRCWS